MLNNFMDLVEAGEMLNNLVITDDQIRFYREHILRYVTDLKTLYKDAKIDPVHHFAAFHMADYLESMGPTHPVRMFGFERFNGDIQKVKTNGQPGEFDAERLSSSQH